MKLLRTTLLLLAAFLGYGYSYANAWNGDYRSSYPVFGYSGGYSYGGYPTYGY